MNGRSNSALSFYELVRAEAAKSLSVSRSVLESAIAASLDLLLEAEIAAPLWLQLPPTTACWPEIERYWIEAKRAEAIYLLGGRASAIAVPLMVLPWQGEGQAPQEWLFLATSPQLSIALAARAVGSDRYDLAWSGEPEAIARLKVAIHQSYSADFPPTSSPTPPAIDPARLTHLLLLRLERIALQRGSEAAKTQFLERGLQELSGTLTRMKTALSLLRSPSLKAPQRERYVALLQQECDRQNSLLGGMQSWVELDEEVEESERLLLADFVPGIVSTYQPLAMEKGIQLGYTIPAQLPAIAFPANALRQIILNLLSNSLRFTRANGRVSVRASQQGDYLQLAFEDTGVGITPDEMPKIFDCFYRGRSLPTGEEAGVGLGLTRVRQMLLRYGGSIAVTSQPNRGSTFKVLLPIARA